MNKLGYVISVVGIAAFAACGSSDNGTTPTASGVFPTSGFVGRTVHVEISGDATNWTDAPTVSFGDGITVSNVTVASPTDLFADITIADSAAPGPRDIGVMDTANGMYALAQAFTVVNPATFSWQGKLAQGSVAVFTIQNHDLDNLFDTTQAGDGLFTPITYPNIAITGPAGTDLSVTAVTPFSITGTALIDVDAQPGPAVVTSGPAGNTTSFAADNLAIEARSATALTSGSPATGMVANPYDSALFQFTTGGSSEVASFAATANDPNAAPAAILLTSSGHFADGVVDFAAASNQITSSATSYYVIYWDNTGEAGYNFSLSGTDHVIAANADDTEPNNIKAQAQTATMVPFALTNGTLTDDTDQDWIKVTATAADVGKTLHAITGAGDPMTDSLLDICDTTSCTTDLSDALAESSDAGYNNEDVSLTIPAAGTYYVVVSASSYGLVQGHNAYEAVVWIE